MLNLKQAEGHYNYLHILDNENQVGRILFGKTIPKELYKSLKTDEEVELLKSVDKRLENMQIDSIRIYDTFKGQGFYRKSVELMEIFTKNSKYKAIVVLANGPLRDLYKSLDYKEIGFLGSVKLCILKKEMNC